MGNICQLPRRLVCQLKKLPVDEPWIELPIGGRTPLACPSKNVTGDVFVCANEIGKDLPVAFVTLILILSAIGNSTNEIGLK
jgi:hypothetical protein